MSINIYPCQCTGAVVFMVSIITSFHVCNLDLKFGINPVDLGNAAAAVSGYGKQEVTGRSSKGLRKS